MRAHLDDMLSHYGTAAMRLARKHIAWYAHGLPGAAELREIANNNTNAAMVFAAVDQFFEALDLSDVAAMMRSPSKSLPSDRPDSMDRTGYLRYDDHDVDHRSGVSMAQILASLPNPIFVLDADNCFIYLNQAAEMFFQSSQMILFGTPLNGFIPADSSLFSMLQRARDQHVSVGDQGLELAGPKLGLGLLMCKLLLLETRLACCVDPRARAG